MKLLPVVQTILIALALAPVATSAQTVSEVISGDLTIERDLYVSRDILVGSAILDNSTETWPAYSLKADSVMGNTYIDEFAYGRITTWTWNIQHNGYLPRRVMALDSTGKLRFHNPSNQLETTIILDFNDRDPSIEIAGKRVLTESSINGGNALFGGIVPPNTGHIAFGLNATAENGASGTAYYAIAIGNGTLSSGWGAVSLGDAAIASEQNATALGERSKAYGKNSTAIGATAKAEGGNSLAMGLAASAGGSSSLAMGVYAIASGQSAMALGGTSNATGNQSIALGAYSIASGQEAIAIGRGASAPEPQQIVLGSFNQDEAGAKFILANGTDFGTRSNLFTIMKNGRGVFRSTSFVDPATPTTPQAKEALTVEGAATIKGTLRVQPAGDLPMGAFTAGGLP